MFRLKFSKHLARETPDVAVSNGFAGGVQSDRLASVGKVLRLSSVHSSVQGSLSHEGQVPRLCCKSRQVPAGLRVSLEVALRYGMLERQRHSLSKVPQEIPSNRLFRACRLNKTNMRNSVMRTPEYFAPWVSQQQ